MPSYQAQVHESMLLPVLFSEQVVSCTFAFALDCLMGDELDLSALDAC